MSAPAQHDVLLVGGGLQNALIALALLEHRPELRLCLVERAGQVGGNHTWCFHAEDLPRSAEAFVAPLIEHRWDGYEVRFPAYRRSLASPYFGFGADRLRAVLHERFAARPGCTILAGAEAVEVGAREVLLADGRRLAARLVVDARGPAGAAQAAGFQKFVGQEVVLTRPHGLRRPVVMDAVVPQRDGFRFFYLLPLGEDRLLVEDTRFADRPDLHREELRAEIACYCAAAGFRVEAVLREEVGVLPMPWRGAAPAASASPLRAGYAGGFLHPATGYSFPVAVRLAELIGRLGAEPFGAELGLLVRRLGRQSAFARLLNRLLFRWFHPEQRRHVFERFYRLPEARIRRFYALQTTAVDRARILLGRPPRGFSLRARMGQPRRTHEPVRI